MKNTGWNETRRRIGIAAVCLVLAVCYLLLFSVTTSPLTDTYGGDSAFFLLVGRGMLHGHIPYRDFFDMKGPWLFFAECLGQMVCEGRTGAFLMQTVSLTLALTFFVFSLDLAQPRRRFTKYLLLLPCAWTAIHTVGGGNMTEELALCPLALTLYLTLRYFVTLEKSREPVPFAWREGLVFGAAFGVLLFSRINNAGLIGAEILAIAAVLIVTRQFSCLWKNAAAFLGGIAVTAIPVFVYCGCYGMIGEMLDQVFLFGFRYSSASTGLMGSLRSIWYGRYRCYLLPPAVTVLYPFLNGDKYYYKILAAVGTVFTVICISLGNNFEHYYALTIPLMALNMFFLARMLREKRLWRNAAVYVCVLAALMAGARGYVFQQTRQVAKMVVSPSVTEYDRDAAAIAARITDDGSVYCWTPQPRWYCIAEKFPASRCCGWQSSYVELSAPYAAELEDFLTNGYPDWLAVDTGYAFTPEYLLQTLEAHYEEVCRNGNFVLYHAVR